MTEFLGLYMMFVMIFVIYTIKLNRKESENGNKET